MQAKAHSAQPPGSSWLSRAYDWLERRTPWSYFLLGLLGLVFAVFAFYQVENWRGERAWRRCKQQLAARGQKMDWAGWVPAPIPDGENFFEAPKVKEWFTTPSPNDLTRRLCSETVNMLAALSNGPPLAHISIHSPTNEVRPDEADLVLRYVASGPAVFLPVQSGGAPTAAENAEHASAPVLKAAWTANQQIPLIIFDDVPLQDAIRNLARQCPFTYVLHPEIFRPRDDADEPPELPAISIRLENLTAEQALAVILNRHGFELLPAKGKTTHLIRKKDPSRPEVFAAPSVRELLQQRLRSALGRAAAGMQVSSLLAEGDEQVRPIRIALQTERFPAADELTKIIPGVLLGPACLSTIRLSARPAGNGYDLCFAEPPMTAAGYLQWSDQFNPDLEALRQALARPGAQLPGQYRDPLTVPHLNFGAVRFMAQLIGQRAKAHLLLGQPDAALEELALMHKLRRPLEARPVGLVLAMMNVALAGMCEEVVADGFRLKAWRDPQLIRIQALLQEIDVLPQVAKGLRFERVFCLHSMSLPPRQLWELSGQSPKTNFWQILTNPKLLAAHLAPRGWVRHNMVLAAHLEQMSIDAYDPERRLISPAKLEEADRCMAQALNPASANSYLAVTGVPNYNRAWVVPAHSQTIASVARIACALERYYLSCGHLPEQLEQLAPQFLESVPRDAVAGLPFRYRPLKGPQFLLYSDGWNQVDEGGAPAPPAYGRNDLTKGDWAWQAGED